MSPSTAHSGAATAAVTFAPLIKVVFVKAPPEKAFERFTAELGTWWPLATHSVGEGEAESVSMEGRVGGRIVERLRDGSTCTWGTLTGWDPPRRVAFSWHPGREAGSAQDVEVRFEPADGGTRTKVVLTHSGFERMGAQARMARRAYPLGWEYVLGRYAGRRDPVMGAISALTWVLGSIRRATARKA